MSNSTTTAASTTPALTDDNGGVQLRSVTKRFGNTTVLHGIDLNVADGQLVALLGPSGCGKTTALRIIAGFERASSGQVFVGGRDVTQLRPAQRGVGIVFQAYSLFPHMTALDNVAYGLKVRGMPSGARRRRAGELLDLVGLSSQAEQFPHQLSGGQQQRVALARAFAIEPQVLLLDEPLSALDARVRVQLREEIRRIQRESGTTTLMVTHDQEEALTIADQVAVMNGGRIEQFAGPEDVYRQPRTPFVAEFVGVVNRIEATVTPTGVTTFAGPIAIATPGRQVGDTVDVLVRPEDLHLDVDSGAPTTVTSLVLRGALTSVEVSVPYSPIPLRVDISTSTARDVHVGATVGVRFDIQPGAAIVDEHRPTKRRISPPEQ